MCATDAVKLLRGVSERVEIMAFRPLVKIGNDIYILNVVVMFNDLPNRAAYCGGKS